MIIGVILLIAGIAFVFFSLMGFLYDGFVMPAFILHKKQFYLLLFGIGFLAVGTKMLIKKK